MLENVICVEVLEQLSFTLLVQIGINASLIIYYLSICQRFLNLSL